MDTIIAPPSGSYLKKTDINARRPTTEGYSPAQGPKRAENAAPTSDTAEAPAIPGSNSFAVAGALSARGAAIVENDMHLGLREPNIWYRARLKVEDPSLDITGVTLPGAPTIVAGSNGRVAWGFTNSMVDTSDVVLLEPSDGDANRYQTPDGPKELNRVEELLCATCANSESLMVEESVWGPVIGLDSRGRKLAGWPMIRSPSIFKALLI